MAHTGDVVTETVEAVRFGFMSAEEVRRLSVVKVTSAISIDLMNRPNPFGLYDPAFGPMDERRRDLQRPKCKTCGQQELDCPGHCGHIDLVYPVYHPLMFNFLYNILQTTCLFCLHFRNGRAEVERCVSLLRLIGKGDVVRARDLMESDFEVSLPADSAASHESCSTVHSLDKGHEREHPKPQHWTSLQLTEAMSVINKFLKLKQTQCKNCKAKNPKITKPTFGWLLLNGMPSSHARQNTIMGCTMTGSFSSEAQPEVDNSNNMNSFADGFEISEKDTIYADSDGAENRGKKGRKKESRHLSLDFTKWMGSSTRALLPSEVKNILMHLWENEFELCSFISDIQQHGFAEKMGHNILFLETILVPPIKFRPPTGGGDSVMEHPQTVLLTKVLLSNISLGNACTNNAIRSNIIVNRWRDLQFSINMLFDSKTASGQGRKEMASGICQLLEKKEGLFRQKMMGKRVNFACRSVISPDPYLAVNEIGIPPYFATCLTYPEKVTSWNTVKLREAILNGPDSHPGARKYIDKLGTTILSSKKKDRFPVSRRLHSSRGALMEIGEYYGNEGKVVLRHLRDGDVVLVNRQPTLHKPSMMAHIVRVLKGEKTIRMHYANCSTYNADFDGDEMNVHFPQDEISRAEAYNIVNANNQYVRPSNAEPLRSLIQDHIISAVLLSVKDTFLTRNEFSQLLYGSGVSYLGSSSSAANLGQKFFVSSSKEEMLPILPAIWKPIPLWTGKQVITAILNHITEGRKPFTVEKAMKVPRDFFQCRPGNKAETEREVSNEKKAGLESEGGEVESQLVDFEEDKLMIFNNEFVRGVIDKAQFSDYGLVHTVQELYGSDTAGVLLSVLSRLFTIHLQMHGFTCGVDDLLIQKDKDIARVKQLENCETKVAAAYHKYFGGDESEIEPTELQLKIERTLRRGGEAALASLDRSVISVLNENSSGGVLSELLSVGLVKPSGKNCISLMTTTGAKGSKVNFQQISSHLGQQELEGKRVPRMVSGKTLPCFIPWDWAARAGGFVSDRFLSGLRPQDYYFHCMAGRDGLVDTAVKTSRSGYLQRCLIKNLEGLKVNYDHTVRDADGSVVQFKYGEDGVDVHQTSFIKKFDTLEANVCIFSEKMQHQLVEVEDGITQKSSDQLEDAKDLTWKIRLPRVSEANAFIKLPQGLQKEAWKHIEEKKKVKVRPCYSIEPEDFVELVKYKFFSSLAQPGEPVGVLAGQSVGEPSTQMTLNTFHLAGRGEMNVTLGVPRLQEILMLASNDIKTPVMTCPMHEGKTKNDALELADKMKKITVADLMGSMEVSVEPFAVHNNEICSIYKLMMTLQKCEGYPKHSVITEKDWKHILEVVFLRELEDAIQNHLVLLSRITGIKNFVTDSQPKASDETDNDVPGSISNGNENDEDDDDGSNDDKAEDFGSDAKRVRKQATDEVDYDDDDSSEEEQQGEASLGILDMEDQQPSDEDEIIDHDNVAPDKKKDDLIGNPSNLKDTSESDMVEEITIVQHRSKKKQKFVSKETDRAIYVACRKFRSNEKSGLHFEVHFKFANEPHILLAQIAQTTAKKVCIQNPGKVDKCRVTDCSEGQVIYYGEDPKDRKQLSVDAKKNVPALHTSGVDFETFWKLQDHLDVRYVYSNNIHAVLNTYGVEAARETIIREISHVFNSYGITVNIRHLSLIADFMTHSGGYRPMNRLGGIAESISPFSKMTFETASKFIVEAAKFGETDNLETPSARICLGLPVRMGTGSFGLLQKLEIDVQ